MGLEFRVPGPTARMPELRTPCQVFWKTFQAAAGGDVVQNARVQALIALRAAFRVLSRPFRDYPGDRTGLFAIVAAGKSAQPTADSAVLLSRTSMSGFLRFSIWGLERRMLGDIAHAVVYLALWPQPRSANSENETPFRCAKHELRGIDFQGNDKAPSAARSRTASGKYESTSITRGCHCRRHAGKWAQRNFQSYRKSPWVSNALTMQNLYD